MDFVVAESMMRESDECVVTASPVGEILHGIEEVWNMIIFYSDAQFLRNYSRLAHFCHARVKDTMQKRIMWILGHFLPRKENRQELFGLMKSYKAGIGGWQALRIIAPSCENVGTQQRDVMTFYTPAKSFPVFVEFFHQHGYRRQNTIRDMDSELQKEYYADTISAFQRMVCTDPARAFRAPIIDIVASVNTVATLPVFRLPTTLLWNFVGSDAIFIANPVTTVKFQGVINPALTFLSNHITLPTLIDLSIDWLNIHCGMQICRNPASFCHHQCGPGSIDMCTHSERSTASPHTFFFEFSRDTVKYGLPRDRFFKGDGIVWRIGGWSCYKGGRCMPSVLVVVPDGHRASNNLNALEQQERARFAFAPLAALQETIEDVLQVGMENSITNHMTWMPEPADRLRFGMTGDSYESPDTRMDGSI